MCVKNFRSLHFSYDLDLKREMRVSCFLLVQDQHCAEPTDFIYSPPVGFSFFVKFTIMYTVYIFIRRNK